MKNIDPKWHYWTIYERRLLLDLLAAEKASLKTKGFSYTPSVPMSIWWIFLFVM